MQYDRSRDDIKFALANDWEYVRTTGRNRLEFRYRPTGRKCRMSKSRSDCAYGARKAIRDMQRIMGDYYEKVGK